MLWGNRGRADDHLGAVGTQYVALVLTDLVRADEHAPVPPLLSDDRQADTGVATGRLANWPAGPDQAVFLGVLDHLHRDPVLDRAAGVQVLDLGENPCRHIAGPRVHPDQGRGPDPR